MNATKYLYLVTNTDGAIVFRGEREAAYEVAAAGSLLTVRPIPADQAFFEVSAEWMNKTGNGNAAQIFPVVLVETNRIGGRGFDAFVILDTSGFPAMFSKSWTVAAARGRFVDSALPDGACIASYWTDGKPSAGLGKNKGRRTAIAYSVNKQMIVSFPPRLNAGRIPELDEVPAILAGVSVAAACTVFNKANIVRLAERMNADSLDWCALPNNDDDEFILRADLDGIYIADGSTGERFERVADSWATENARIQAERAAAPRCVPGEPVPAAFMVFTSYTVLKALHPTVSAEFQLRKTSDGPVYPGAIYPVRITGPMSVWIGEPCATQQEAERAALAYLRSLAPVGARVDLSKPGDTAAAPVLVAAPGAPVESNADIMARAVAFIRGRRLADEARAACECHQCAVPDESDDEENARALQHEEERAAAARRLAGSCN